MKGISHRFIPVTAILIGVVNVTCAQNNVEVVKSLQTFKAASLDYRQKDPDIRDVKGSPYLTEDFKEGMILMGNTLYKGIPLRYNVYNDRFEARLQEGTIEIDPETNPIDTLYYNGLKFVRRFLQPGSNKIISNVAVIYNAGAVSLLKKYRIVFNPAANARAYTKARPAEFKVAKPYYYLARGEEQIMVRGVKSISEMLQADKKEVRSYITSNRIDIDDEVGLIQICSHFSERGTP